MYPQDALALDVHRRRQADATVAHRAEAARRSTGHRVNDRSEATPSVRRHLVVRASTWLRGLVGTSWTAHRVTPTMRRA